MSTTAELAAHRLTAGARYAAAITEFREARADLDALDRILVNSNVGYAGTLPSFGPAPDLIRFRHAQFAPNVGGNFLADTEAAAAVRWAAWPTPDE